MQNYLKFNFDDSSDDLSIIRFYNVFIQHDNPIDKVSFLENEFEDIIYNISNNANKKVEIALKKNNIFKIIKNINKNKQKQKQKRINLYNKLGQIEINDNDNNSNTVYATQEYKYLIFNKATKYYTTYFLMVPLFKDSKRITKTRKYNNDDIFKKIRGKFLKEIIKKKLNKKLEHLKIVFKFVFTDISQNTKIEDNIIDLNSTLEEVLKSVKSNEKVFEELEKIDGGDKELKAILSAKMEYLYKEYFNSQEFQNSIKELIDKREYYEYIYLYIQKSKEFFDYYNIKKLKNREIYKSE